jgi:hypothetical protein
MPKAHQRRMRRWYLESTPDSTCIIKQDTSSTKDNRRRNNEAAHEKESPQARGFPLAATVWAREQTLLTCGG